MEEEKPFGYYPQKKTAEDNLKYHQISGKRNPISLSLKLGA